MLPCYPTGVPTSNETYRRCIRIFKALPILLYVSAELSRTACSRITRFICGILKLDVATFRYCMENPSGRKEGWTSFNKLNRRQYSMEGTPRGRPARDEEWRKITESLTFGRRIYPAHRTVIAYLIYIFYHSGKSRQRGNRTTACNGCDESVADG